MQSAHAHWWFGALTDRRRRRIQWPRMHSPDKQRSEIAARVLRALSLNRAGGFHFAGRFLDADFQPFERGMRATLDPGPHCVLANGDVDMVSLCIFFDVVLGTSIRKVLGHNSRLATTNIH